MNCEDVAESLKIDGFGFTDGQAQHIAEIIRIVKQEGASPRTFSKLLIKLNEIEGDARQPLLERIQNDVQ